MSLWRLDKIPYGTQYAYENLSSLFPNAVIRTSNKFPVLFGGENAGDTIRALIILTTAFAPEPDEMKSLIRFASSGNHVFISAMYLEDTVLAMLHLKRPGNESNYGDFDSADQSIQNEDTSKKTKAAKTNLDTLALARISLQDPVTKEWFKYSYPGEFSSYHFKSIDTVDSRILGRNNGDKADFVRISFAHNGAIYIHLEPLAFSNFFLLHKENKSYYDRAFSWIPVQTGVVEWSDYFRYSHRGNNYSALHFVLSNKSLRWAFWLTLILFLLIFLLESKRKQRAIAEMPKPRNASVDFVKTISRLYFQQKNNQNLAIKMVSAFLESIRSVYNLPTSVLDDRFCRDLAFRTGKQLTEITDLMQSIHDARLNISLTDREILDLHQKINQFNKPV
jgi:hypothetical protein